MKRPFAPSGDLVVDRRYQYAADLAAAGDCAAAADLLEQTRPLAPRWGPLLYALGRARAGAGDEPGAAAAFRAYLDIDSKDALGAAIELALLGAADLDVAPPGYVAALFDSYAEDFDDALPGPLSYAAPRLLASRLEAAGRRFARALELGCGTGLAGEAIRPYADYLEGVDLSHGMLARARARSVYDALHCAPLLERLRTSERFDLIVAADVFPYIGDLGPTVAQIARTLVAGGLAVLTVEADEGGDWMLRESRRFAHSPAYLRRLAHENDLRITALDREMLRSERGAPVAGLIAALTR